LTFLKFFGIIYIENKERRKRKMYITVQFKNKNKDFVGKLYDYALNKEETPPKQGDIIRMMDDNYNYLCYGTRVKVIDVVNADKKDLTSIRYIKTTLDDKEVKSNGLHKIGD
jgi:hypothetical protein